MVDASSRLGPFEHAAIKHTNRAWERTAAT